MKNQGNKCVKVNTKVSLEDYAMLLRVCEQYGFASIYQVLQVLLHCFLRHTSVERDAEFEDGMSAEIGEMFEELAHPEASAPTHGRRYPKREMK